MRIYVAGPMTGLPRFNYDAFNAAERDLKALGYAVENPTRGEEPPDAGAPFDPLAYRGFLRAGLRQLLDCDAVAVLPDWQRSRGATLEVATARAIEMPVYPIHEWLGGQLSDPVPVLDPPLSGAAFPAHRDLSRRV